MGQMDSYSILFLTHLQMISNDKTNNSHQGNLTNIMQILFRLCKTPLKTKIKAETRLNQELIEAEIRLKQDCSEKLNSNSNISYVNSY